MTVLMVTNDLRPDYMSVRWEVFVEEQCVPLMLEIDARDFDPRTMHLAAYSDEQDAIVGAIRILPAGKGTYRLGRLAVRRTARKNGIGAELVEAAHRILVAHTEPGQSTRVILEAQLQARGFYESLGYAATSEETIWDAGIEHVEMAIELARP